MNNKKNAVSLNWNCLNVVVQSNILNGKFKKIYLITKLQDSRPTEFLIENMTNHSLGLRQSYLNIKFKVANSDGSSNKQLSRKRYGS